MTRSGVALPRVCYLISLFHPRSSGAERQAQAQGAELARRGYSVGVLTRALPGEPRDETIDGIQVHRWIQPLAVGPAFGLSYVASTIRAMRRLRSHYDLIHTHQALWESIATGLGRDWLGHAPVLVQPASSGYYGEAREMARTRGFPVLRRLALRNRHFAAISADIEREWRDLGVPADQITRTASGVDAAHFRPGPSPLEATLPPRPRAIFTGRLHPQKNLDLLLDIWPEVAARTRASLILVGDGPERARLQNKARVLGIQSRVHFAGAVSCPADHLRASDLFVLPSVAEGMSNSLLEAMACGLPSVVSDIGGNVELIRPDREGLLIDPADPAAWRHALVSLIADRERRLQMGTLARAWIEEFHALPVVVDQYLSLYDQMLLGTSAL